ncbi:cwf18 domain containing protein [Hirsutella rhossiliensis]
MKLFTSLIFAVAATIAVSDSNSLAGNRQRVAGYKGAKCCLDLTCKPKGHEGWGTRAATLSYLQILHFRLQHPEAPHFAPKLSVHFSLQFRRPFLQVFSILFSAAEARSVNERLTVIVGPRGDIRRLLDPPVFAHMSPGKGDTEQQDGRELTYRHALQSELLTPTLVIQPCLSFAVISDPRRALSHIDNLIDTLLSISPATAQDTPANVSLEDRQLVERNLTIAFRRGFPQRTYHPELLLVHRNSFFLGCVATYTVDKRNHGIALLGDLYNDFTGWSYDDFELINPRLRSRLRTLLRIRGIYMGKANSSISRALCGLLTSNELPEWDENELLGQEVAENTVAYKVKQKLLQGTVKAAISSLRPINPLSKSLSINGANPLGISRRSHAYTSIPPVRFENEEVEADLTIRFIKIWDKKLAYTGEPYDIFDDKIRKFMSEAQSFFLHEISTDLTFAEMYQKMKEHFDTEINQKMYHTHWSTLTFSRLRAEMPGKSSDEVLQALLTKLRLCRRALGDKSGGEGGLIDATLRAFDHRYLPCKMNDLNNPVANIPKTWIEDMISTSWIANFSEIPAEQEVNHKGVSQIGRRNATFAARKVVSQRDILKTREKQPKRSIYERGFHGQSRSYAMFLADYEGESQDQDDSSTEESDDSDSSDPYESFYAAATFCPTKLSIIGSPVGIKLFNSDEPTQFILDRYSQDSIQGIMPDTVQFRDDRKPEPVRFEVDFHIVNVPTPFLLCLADMDRLGVYLNNVTNELVGNGVSVPVIRRWGHAWFFLRKQEASVAYLTEAELRRLHTRFGHPSVYRLHKLLNSAGHDVEIEALEMIKKFCHYCQMKSDPPRRFKFSLKDDCDFNYEVIVDTSPPCRRFLSNMTAKETWLALKQCTNFAAAEFQAEAKLMGITSHWAVGKVEKYHVPVRRAYDILKAELKDTVSPDQVLQMAFKAVNDTAGPDGLVPTLLVFGALPRMTMDSPPTPSAMARAKALRKINAQRKVQTALNTRNGPDTALRLPLSLALGSEVRVFREKHGWQGPYKVLEVTDTEIAVDLDNGPAKFRTLAAQTHQHNNHSFLNTIRSTTSSSKPSSLPPTTQQPLPLPTTEDQPKPFEYPEPKRPRRQSTIVCSPVQFIVHHEANAFLVRKEMEHLGLAKRLRAEGKITSTGFPFEASDTLELTNLLAAGVIVPEEFDANKHGGYRVFKSRMKSRLVVQGYNDDGKRGILTQAPTISRPAQRVALALAPFLCTRDMFIMIRDITMAYTQSQTKLARKISRGTILRIVKPLYGIAEAGAHWFNTYHDHHCRKLNMETSSFDPCLLITANNIADKDLFGIAALQTDDTFIVGTDAFLKIEEKELCFKAKPKEILQEGSICDFNGSRLTIQNGCVIVRQKGQAQNLEEINLQASSRHQDYAAQRARGAYIASICQPEATYDCSVAAQAQEPVNTDFKALNKRIEWQINNPDRGLCYIPIDLESAKIFVFTDGSFANNKDLSSQIGFVIIIANETAQSTDSFSIRGNILHWSSTKCKRVTRSVLASEIYGLTSGFDLAFVIKQTVNTIAQRLDLKQIRSSFAQIHIASMKKRLMIDIMALRQAYESRDIAEIRWVNGADNPADAMTKASQTAPSRNLIGFSFPSSALPSFFYSIHINEEILVSIFQPHPALEMRPMMAVTVRAHYPT